MIYGNKLIGETHYNVLLAREDATHDKIRVSYRSAVLNTHPDKLKNPTGPSCENGTEDKFFRVQKAWEILGDPKSRALYDNELRALRREDAAAASEEVGFEDMGVEDGCDWVELCYQSRCGDCFSVDSFELEKMGYELLRNKNKVSFRIVEDSPASVVLPCGSCSLKVSLLIDPSVCVTVCG